MPLMNPEQWEAHCRQINQVARALGVPPWFAHEANVMAKIEAEEPIWFEKCQNPDCDSEHAWRQRQDTKYVEDHLNFVTLCADCAAENAAHWEGMWNDYYSSVM